MACHSLDGEKQGRKGKKKEAGMAQRRLSKLGSYLKFFTLVFKVFTIRFNVIVLYAILKWLS